MAAVLLRAAGLTSVRLLMNGGAQAGLRAWGQLVAVLLWGGGVGGEASQLTGKGWFSPCIRLLDHAAGFVDMWWVNVVWCGFGMRSV